MNMFKPSEAKSIKEYIELISDPRRSEIKKLHEFIQKAVPDLKAHFAINMIGYGEFHYKSKSGREGDWPVISLASQKNYISVYVCAVKDGKYVAENYKQSLPAKTGKKDLAKISIGKSCISFKKIADVDLKVLEKILKEAAKNPGFEI